jgi:hypothetical protein
MDATSPLGDSGGFMALLTALNTSFVPDCNQGLKPTVGMSFDSLEAVENCYN